MKYLVLLYSKEDAWSAEEHKTALEESIRLCHQLHAENQYCGASPLQAPQTATCVRVRDGITNVNDGPYAETKEHLGGYFLIDVSSLEEAIQIAARIPGSHRGTAEIRPILEVTGLPTPEKTP
ncbi:MAG: YciI family protein [Puniceicoccales bacterium]